MDVGSHTVSGLENGTEYQFEVRAVNAGGKSGPSSRARAKAIAKPAAPTGLVANSVGRLGHPALGLRQQLRHHRLPVPLADRMGSGAWSSWTDVPATQDGIAFHPSDITSFTVTGLNGER